MPFLYTLITVLLMPMAFGHLLQRSRRQPEYRRHWGERLGFAPRLDGPVLWLHAVSVGETRAAAPLVEALLQRYPDHRILLTHTTPTGRAAGREVFAQHAGRIVQAYLPYDLPWAVARFLRHTQPALGILMETEIWPNLYAAAARRGIPLFLVNARMSAKSAAGYARLGKLTRTTLQHLTAIAAQTEADAARLAELGRENKLGSDHDFASSKELGSDHDFASSQEGLTNKSWSDPNLFARRISVCGNLKFDVAAPADTAQRAAELRALFGARPVWVAASTRESGSDSEEAMIVEAWLNAKNKSGSDHDFPLSQDGLTNKSWSDPNLLPPLLVLVPRHPQRFEAVAALLKRRGVSFVRRSEGQPVRADTQVVLGDSMGEMAAYFAAADLAFIGGSLLPLGGQNLIEAAAAGCPVLIGPHSFNFAAATLAALAAGAAVRVADSTALVQEVLALLADRPRLEAMRVAGRAFAAQHRGATARCLALLDTASR